MYYHGTGAAMEQVTALLARAGPIGSSSSAPTSSSSSSSPPASSSAAPAIAGTSAASSNVSAPGPGTSSSGTVAVPTCKPSSQDALRWERRLQKELMAFVTDPPPGLSIDADATSQNLQDWTVDLRGADGTLYEGENFQLNFKFNSKYPFDAPQVMFVGNHIPVHPHIYSNGHICLSILTEDWSPAHSVQSVCLSIMSMLSSCKDKKRPVDNSLYVKTCNKNPKKTKWWYHDDTV